MSKHTPGPWKYLGRVTTRNDDTMEWPTVECAFRRYIKPEGRTSDECEANARLIAAAPEMYEALRHLAHNARASGAEMGLALEVAQDVLAKIEGGGE